MVIKIVEKDEADVTFFGVQYIGGTNQLYLSNAENSTKEARLTCDVFFGVPSKCWKTSFFIVIRRLFEISSNTLDGRNAICYNV